MKKNHLVIITIIFISIRLFSQSPTFQWGKLIGTTTTYNERINSISVDNQGNSYVAGIRILPSTGFETYFAKYTPGGSTLFFYSLIGSVAEIKTIFNDSVGNIYVGGYFNGTKDFNPTAGTLNMTSNGGYDAFFAKYSSSGNPVYVRRIGSTGDDMITSLKLDKNYNIIVAGTFSNTVDFDLTAGVANRTSNGQQDIFVASYNQSGNLNFANTAGGTFADFANDVDTDDANNIYTVGQFRGNNVDFDPGAGTNLLSYGGGGTNVYVVKYSSAGIHQWAWALTCPPGGDDGTCIKVNPKSNRFFIGGGYRGPMDFNPGPGVNVDTSSYCCGFVYDITPFFAAYDLNGNYKFSHKAGICGGSCGMEVLDLVSDKDNRIIICGNGDSGDFDPGPATYIPNFNNMYEYFVAGYDSVGLFKFYMGANFSTGASGTSAIPMTMATDGSSLYMGGLLNGSAWDLNSGAGVNTFTSAGGDDGLLVRYNTCSSAPSQPSAITGNSVICNGSSQLYSITPISGVVNYSWTLPSGWTGSSTNPYISVTTGTSSGIISVYAINGCGTSIVRTLSVTVTTSVTAPGVISGASTICSASTLQTYSVSAVAGATSYSWTLPGGWTGSSSSNIINVTSGATGGNISVAATGACNTSSASIKTITISTPPTISVNSGSICSGQSFTMIPSGASTYTYSSGSSVVSPASNASYSVSGTNSAGCISASPAVSSITVAASPTAVASTSQTITCTFPSITLNGSGVTSYSWTGPGIVSGSNTANPLVNMAGSYSLAGTSGSCNSNTALVTVIANNAPPSLSITSNNPICIGNSATLTAGGATTYSWSTGSSATSIIVSPTITTNYILSGTNSANGCFGNINKSITVNPLPIVSANTSNSIICGPPYQGTAILTGSGANTYTWNSTATTVTIAVSPSVTTSYTLTGTDVNGCMNSAAITQSVSTCTGIEQLFTNNELNIYPNPFHDKLYIISDGRKHQLQIYNAIGALIFESLIESEKTEIGLSNQPNGIYFIRINNKTIKSVKE
jgi:hypothetical protein